MRIAPLPRIAENPEIFPRAPEKVATSNNAAPIPVKPFAISVHDNSDIFDKALEIGSSACTAIRMDPLPSTPEKPDILPRAPENRLNSARAPPIPVKPFPISSHVSAPIFFNVSAIGSKACIAIKIAPLPRIAENPEIFPRAPLTIPNSPRATPIAVNPFPISSQSIDPKFLRLW